MPWGNKALPEFGVLSGVKVVHCTQTTAGPFAAEILADYGADVIWIENIKAPDMIRLGHSYASEVERKNQRAISLNIPSPQGRQIFLKLLEGADIFIENSKGGQYAKWGLSDEVLWETNPRLIIAHISGFGQSGVPEYVSRASYDQIAQAFSGYMYMNSNPETAPYAAGPLAADFFTALYTAVSVLAALNKVKQTGKGESIDIAQFELMMRVQQRAPDGFNGNDKNLVFAGYPSPVAGIGSYKCRDGRYVSCNLGGAGVFRRCCEFLGLEYGGPDIPEGTQQGRIGAPAGDLYQSALLKYFSERTADEAQKEMLGARLPISKINTFADLIDDPHVKARGVFSEFENFKGKKLRCVGPVPKFKNYPGKVWRAAPGYGMDNEEVLSELGYTPEDISALYDEGIIRKDAELKYTYPY